MTPNPSNEVKCFESTHRYQHHSRPHVRHQHDPENKAYKQFNKFCNYRRKTGHSISRCFKRQTSHYRKKTLNPENKTNNNHSNQQLENCLGIFSGTTKIYLINELPIPTSPDINQIIETNLNLHIGNTLPDKVPLHMTNIIVKIQIGCTILTLDFLLQLTTTMIIIPVILEIVGDQLLLIEKLQIINLCLHKKKPISNHKSNC